MVIGKFCLVHKIKAIKAGLLYFSRWYQLKNIQDPRAFWILFMNQVFDIVYKHNVAIVWSSSWTNGIFHWITLYLRMQIVSPLITVKENFTTL